MREKKVAAIAITLAVHGTAHHAMAQPTSEHGDSNEKAQN